MKRTILFLTVTSLFFGSLSAQEIKYESSFNAARSLAMAQHKPLAVLVTIQPPVSTPNFLNGLSDRAVIETFNNNFINYKVDRDDTTSREIISKYKIYRYPSYTFFDEKGGLMFTDIAFLARSQPLLDLAKRAMEATKEKSLVDYDSTYASGNVTTTFLKAYILKRQSTGVNDNVDLIEKYADGLTVKDLDNYAEVLFILKAGPLADGKAYKLAHLNTKIIDSIFKTEPLPVRVAMNNATITNTMNSAIANRNAARAATAASFTRSTWTSDPIEGQKNWFLKMLQYYKGVKDTLGYLRMASGFFDQYYMRIGMDSIRRKDSLNFQNTKNKAFANAKLTSPDSTKVRTVSFIYPKDNGFANELNNAAWYFYQIAGSNDEYLLKAMLWSKRAVEMDPRSAYYDTYAHLLYKLKFYDESESMQRKAIKSGKTEKADIKAFEQEYEKIKKRSL